LARWSLLKHKIAAGSVEGMNYAFSLKYTKSCVWPRIRFNDLPKSRYDVSIGCIRRFLGVVPCSFAEDGFGASSTGTPSIAESPLGGVPHQVGWGADGSRA